MKPVREIEELVRALQPLFTRTNRTFRYYESGEDTLSIIVEIPGFYTECTYEEGKYKMFLEVTKADKVDASVESYSDVNAVVKVLTHHLEHKGG